MWGFIRVSAQFCGGSETALKVNFLPYQGENSCLQAIQQKNQENQNTTQKEKKTKQTKNKPTTNCNQIKAHIQKTGIHYMLVNYF